LDPTVAKKKASNLLLLVGGISTDTGCLCVHIQERSATKQHNTAVTKLGLQGLISAKASSQKSKLTRSSRSAASITNGWESIVVVGSEMAPKKSILR
jgi:hypothetical protein